MPKVENSPTFLPEYPLTRLVPGSRAIYKFDKKVSYIRASQRCQGAERTGQPWSCDRTDSWRRQWWETTRRQRGEAVDKLDPCPLGVLPSVPNTPGRPWWNTIGCLGSLFHQQETFINRISGSISDPFHILLPTQVKFIGMKMLYFCWYSFWATGHETSNPGILQSFWRTSLHPLQIWQVKQKKFKNSPKSVEESGA